MVITFYVAAGMLLLGALIADSPFAKTDLVILAVACFLFARFIRIERRLDKIEGFQRTSKVKRAWSWALSNRELLVGIGSFAVAFVWFWYNWDWLTQSTRETMAALSPKRPHPWLHSFLGASPVATTLLVWFPAGVLFASMILGLVAFWVIGVAILLGIWPRRWQQRGSSVPHNSRQEQIVGWAMGAFCVWAVLAMTYAKKETDSFFSLFPDLSRQMSDWIWIVVFGGWMPLVFIAMAVQRLRERRNSDHAD